MAESSDDSNVLLIADSLVHGERQKHYGRPFDDYSRVAKIWEVILGCPVTPKQAALCMVGIKISREINAPKLDNLVDMAGYAEVANMIQQAVDEEGDEQAENES
jgi:hypothetical protein